MCGLAAWYALNACQLLRILKPLIGVLIVAASAQLVSLV